MFLGRAEQVNPHVHIDSDGRETPIDQFHTATVPVRCACCGIVRRGCILRGSEFFCISCADDPREG